MKRWLAVSLGVLFVAICACTSRPPSDRPADLEEGSVQSADVAVSTPVGSVVADASTEGIPVVLGEADLAVGSQGMVVGTSGAAAIEAGVQALRNGGSAVDAALVTALGQVALQPGSFVTYAGIMTMVVYEAESQKLYSMNAGWDIPLQETSPLSISRSGAGMRDGRRSLVPGFMAGLQAAHARFGRLPFEELFDPAIGFAEDGFVVDEINASIISRYQTSLSRLLETKRIFTRETGQFPVAGDLFRQPELAQTLRSVAAEGSDYMYSGPWGRKFVEAIGREGGRITMQDMESYEVIWSQPVHTSYGDYNIYALGQPSFGGVIAVEALNLLEAVRESGLGVAGSDPEVLYWQDQILRASVLSYLPASARQAAFPDRDLSNEARLTKDHARWLWTAMQDGDFAFTKTPAASGGSHSAAIVAADQWGNVVALVHSINSLFWGETGVFVDGVSIGEPAAFQQQAMAEAGPGQRLPDPTNPMIVLRDGVPVVASSCIGQVHSESVQRLAILLDHGLDPSQTLSSPAFLSHDVSAGNDGALSFTTQVVRGSFEDWLIEDLRTMGLSVRELQAEFWTILPARGMWVGLTIDPGSGELRGATEHSFGGLALGY